AEIRRTVWQRDDGQCTFVSASGRRCEEKRRLEFDHIEAAARGGRTSAVNLRLRCRAHNLYTAECIYGIEFMRGKRETARRRAAHHQAVANALADAPARVKID